MKKTIQIIAVVFVIGFSARHIGAQSIEPLGFIPGGAPPSLTNDISGDGTVVVGAGSDGVWGVGFSWNLIAELTQEYGAQR